MSVRWVKRSWRFFLGSLHGFIFRIIIDFPLLFCLTTIFTLIMGQQLSLEMLSLAHRLLIGLVILCLVVVLIIISVNLSLESEAVGAGRTAWSVSQLFVKIRFILTIVIILLLQAIFCLWVVRSKEAKEIAVRTIVGGFTKSTYDLSVLVGNEPIEYPEYLLAQGVILGGDDIGIQFKLPKKSKVSIGDQCQLSGRLFRPEPFDGFDYAAYLESKGVWMVMNVSEYECVPVDDQSKLFTFKSWLIKAKGTLVDRIEKMLPEPQASLLAGIIFGQKRIFSKEFDLAVRNVGVSHVVAASGYNISFVVNLVSLFFGFLEKRARVLLDIAFIVMYCIISGLSPSIIRAGLMYSIFGFSILIGRYMPPINTLLLTLSIFLLFDPQVISDVGFQLSFASTVSLMYLTPILEKFLKRIRMNALVGGVFSSTLACTLGTLPITVYTFRTIPILSVLVNSIVLPFIDTSMALGLLGLSTSYISTAVSKFFFIIVWLQLKLFETVVLFFGGFPWSTVKLN